MLGYKHIKHFKNIKITIQWRIEMKKVTDLHEVLGDNKFRNELSNALHWRALPNNVWVDPSLKGVSTILLDEEIIELENKLHQLKESRDHIETKLKTMLKEAVDKGYRSIALDGFEEYDNSSYINFIGSEEELKSVFSKFEIGDLDVALTNKKFNYGQKCKLIDLVETPEYNGKVVEILCALYKGVNEYNPSGIEYSVIGEGFRFRSIYEHKLEPVGD